MYVIREGSRKTMACSSGSPSSGSSSSTAAADDAPNVHPTVAGRGLKSVPGLPIDPQQVISAAAVLVVAAPLVFSQVPTNLHAPHTTNLPLQESFELPEVLYCGIWVLRIS
jgi:hypothetical protein